jgi:uncharacterized membrane protein/predicted flap endonuclease-1-like 5' DNA nuclease
MGNKNRNLMIAYFPSSETAGTAAEELKHWDHNNPDVKLGGIGVVTYTDGKLHTDKVGSRATGTGAKWGTILGATGGLIFAVATGGVGLIPGVVAGLGAGTLTGTLFHKKIGMSDADRERLMDHLQNGGAALTVMGDDYEVDPTRTQLYFLGGEVEHFRIPDHVAESLEGAAHAIQDTAVSAESAADRAADVDLEEDEMALRAATLVSAVREIDPVDATRLCEAGVSNLRDLYEKAATAKGRQELSKATGIETAVILKWANDLDLSRINGVGVKYADLLEHSGVDTVPELAQRNPANLAQKMAEVNAAQGIVEELPSEKQVADWVAQAKGLPRVITY